MSTRSPQERAFMDGYEAGLDHGIALGRRQAAEERDAEWDVMREHVRRIASTPSYAERCERAGEHRRAARARQIHADMPPADMGVVA